MQLLPSEKIKREILVKRKAETSLKFGKSPEQRTVQELISLGVVNVDKSKGPTSHQVSAYAQKILKVSKGGHSGTLDPAVTGVLPIAFERATRIVEVLLTAGKEYVAIMHLHKEVDENLLRETIKNNFVGKIRQLPPIKSAVKRQWRFRKVYYIEILEIDGKDVLMRIGCQAGTYIRKICHDIGEKLDTGAHMAELRRTKAGGFDESTLVTLQDLADAYSYYEKENNERYLRHCVLPVESAVDHIPKIWVLDSAVNSLCHGMNLKVPGIVKLHTEIQKDDIVAVMTLKDELIAVGVSQMTSKDMLDLEKGLAVDINKVFMEPGVYPRMDF
jgi:H/ACA ribonucleoprotein complex subunit 4